MASRGRPGPGRRHAPAPGRSPRAPGAYSFGVCSAAKAGQAPEPEACQVSPSIGPEVMDTVPPPGVALSAELNLLDYPGNTTPATPAQLQGVTVPSSGWSQPRRLSPAAALEPSRGA